MKQYKLFVLSVLMSLPICAGAAEDTPAVQKQPENVFIVSEYRFEPAGEGKNSDVGQSLCGTRCNSMSVDYLNYTEPGGWRLIKVADNREVRVDLKNPFLAGTCVCVVDEYEVKVNELYMSSKSPQVKEVK